MSGLGIVMGLRFDGRDMERAPICRNEKADDSSAFRGLRKTWSRR